MKYILPFFLLLCSCGLFAPDKDFPDEAPSAPPPANIEVEATPGFVYYIPDVEEFDEEVAVTCEVEELEYFVPPRLVESNVITFVYGTVDFTGTYQVSIEDADHIHVKEVWIEVAAGDDLDFFSWVRIKIGDDLVAWGGPKKKNTYRTQLNIDGSVDIAPSLKDGSLQMTGELRGRLPANDTYLQSHITFLRFYNCE